MQSKRSLGILSFISLIVGISLICIFIFADDFFIIIPFGIILVALSFGLSFTNVSIDIAKYILYDYLEFKIKGERYGQSKYRSL